MDQKIRRTSKKINEITSSFNYGLNSDVDVDVDGDIGDDDDDENIEEDDDNNNNNDSPTIKKRKNSNRSINQNKTKNTKCKFIHLLNVRFIIDFFIIIKICALVRKTSQAVFSMCSIAKKRKESKSSSAG